MYSILNTYIEEYYRNNLAFNSLFNSKGQLSIAEAFSSVLEETITDLMLDIQIKEEYILGQIIRQTDIELMEKYYKELMISKGYDFIAYQPTEDTDITRLISFNPKSTKYICGEYIHSTYQFIENPEYKNADLVLACQYFNLDIKEVYENVYS